MTSGKQLSSQELYDPLVTNGVDYYCGVPDSITAPFSHFLEEHASDRHVITTNEGNAIGLAIGYHIATGKIPLVYMQNSGLSNAMDPLTSLADKSVFNTPMLLIVGWRGKPGVKDEPHHEKQGVITPELLRILEIPFEVLSTEPSEAVRQIREIVKKTREQSRPYALLIEQGAIAEYTKSETERNRYSLSREEALGAVLDSMDEKAVIVTGIGKISRELFEYRKNKNQSHGQDLMVVGGMGHASSIALGIAQQKPEKKVFCLEGDGATLMHLGALPSIGSLAPANFYHIVFNNGSHDSVGGPPTASENADFAAIARACGYSKAISVSEAQSVTSAVDEMKEDDGPTLLEIKINKGARLNLTRPTISPAQNKIDLMTFLD
jgi:phosphonopyruvate decarboxylase